MTPSPARAAFGASPRWLRPWSLVRPGPGRVFALGLPVAIGRVFALGLPVAIGRVFALGLPVAIGRVFALGLALSIGLAGGRALADCNPDPPSDDDAVVCDGTDETGFDGSGATRLTITTDGTAALDDSSALDSAILVSDDNDVTIGVDATITVTEANGFGIRGGDDNDVTNDGTIVVDGAGGTAISLGSNTDPTPDGTPALVNNGTIELNGAGAVGLRADDNYDITNAAGATITVTGDNGTAILGDDDNIVRNDGTITIDGDDGRGIVIDQNTGLPLPNGAISDGTITVNGARGYAIEVGDNAGVAFGGTIDLVGAMSRGLSAGNLTDPLAQANITSGTNGGTLNVIGDDSFGMKVGDGWLEGGFNPSSAGTRNAGNLNVIGNTSFGIYAGDDANTTGDHNSFVSNFTGAVIDVTGTDSVGVSLGGNDFLTEANPALRNVFSFANGGTLQGDADAGPLVEFRNFFGTFENRVYNDTGAAITADLTNQGMANRGIAILGTGGIEAVTNLGDITGDLLLGDGDDRYFHGGEATLDGLVVGGGGTDAATLGASGTTLRTFDVADLVGFETLDVDGNSTADPGWDLANTASFTGLLTVRVRGSLTHTAPLVLGGDLRNEGRIDGDLAATGARTIENLGTIDGAVTLGTGADVFDNDGTLLGDVDLGDGADVFRQGASASVGASSQLRGGAGSDDFVLKAGGSTAGSFDLSRLNGFERVQIEGSAATPQTGWQLTNGAAFTGDVEVLANATLRAPAAITLGGDLLMTSSTTTLDLVASPTEPTITVNGDATFDGTVDVTASGLTPGTFRLIQVDGAVTGTFATENLPANTGFLTYASTYDADGFLLTLTQASTFEDVAAGGNNVAIAAHLDDLFVSTPPGTPINDRLSEYASGGAGIGDLNDFYAALSPEAYDAQTAMAVESGRRLAQLLFDRPRDCTPGELDPWTSATKPLRCHARKLSAWVSGIGAIRTRDAFSGHPEYDAEIGGAVLGIDFVPFEDLELTLALSGQRGTVDVSGAGDADVTIAEVTGHAGWTRGPLRVQGVFSYGHGFHDTSRTVFFDAPGATATDTIFTGEDEHESRRVTLAGHAGFLFEAGPVDVEPHASVDWVWIDQDSIRESGDPFAASLDGRDDDVATVTAGVTLSTVYHHTRYLHTNLEWIDGIWRPTVALRWRQYLTGFERSIDGRLVGAPTSVAGYSIDAKEDRGGFEVEAGLSFVPKHANRLQFDLRYEAYRASHTVEHDLVAKVRIGF